MPKKQNTRRADGRIAVQVYIGTVDGKRKYKTVYGATQKEANKKADELKIKLNKGINITTDNSFECWAEYWINAKKAEVSENQYKLLNSRKNYIVSCIGHLDLNKIRTIDLQQIINSIAENNPNTHKPSAKNTIKDYVQVVSSIFNYAIQNRVIDFDPAKYIKIPQNAPQRSRRALTKEERKHIDDFEHRAKPAAMLMMYSGLRRGEATALLWSDIDFENSTIRVDKSFDFKQNTLKNTKTKAGNRVVSVPQKLIDYLSQLPRKSQYVISSASGKMMSDSAWKRLWDSYIYDLNYEYGQTPKENLTYKKIKKFSPVKIPITINTFTPHDLRHTFCTIMYEAGIDVLVAKEQMGHSDVKTTLSIYTHLNNDHKQKDITKLNDFLND